MLLFVRRLDALACIHQSSKLDATAGSNEKCHDEQGSQNFGPLIPPLRVQLKLLSKIRGDNVNDATKAMSSLGGILGTPAGGSGTPKALFRVCGHADIVRAMNRNLSSLEFQLEGLTVLETLGRDHLAQKEL